MSDLFSHKLGSTETSSLFTDEKIANARLKIIEWLNQSQSGSVTTALKCEAITKIQEIILHSDTELLDEFIDNLLAFSHDPVQDVRRTVVAFMEEVCKTHIEFIPRVINSLAGLLRDPSPQVIKRVIQSCAAVYKNTLQWLCTLVDVSDATEQAWNTLCIMKNQIVDMIDNDNDGIRTNAIKFLEGIVILQTYPDEDSFKKDTTFSLEEIPLTLKIVRRRKLEDEAINIFESLLKFQAASHISSVNLIACTGSLCMIGRMRPTSFLHSVVDGLKQLNSNLPPTLTDSQISSVRKHLKMQLINILKMPAAYELQPVITLILHDLGATHQELVRAYPRMDKNEQIRRAKRAAENAAAAASSALSASNSAAGGADKQPPQKKMKLEKEKPQRQMEIDIDEVEEQQRKSNKMNEQFIIDHMKTKEIVIDMVMANIKHLPSTVPVQFLKNYTPIMGQTIPQQLQKIAQNLAVQMTENRIGPGAVAITKEPPMRLKVTLEEEKSIIMSMRTEPLPSSSSSSVLPTITVAAGSNVSTTPLDENSKLSESARNDVRKMMEDNLENDEDGDDGGGGGDDVYDDDNSGGAGVVGTGAGRKRRADMDIRKEEATKKLRENIERFKGEQAMIPRMKEKAKSLKLQEITKPFPRVFKEKYLLDAIQRIIHCERQSIVGGVVGRRRKILTVMGVTFTTCARDLILKYIMADIKNRMDLAFSWLYEEYSLLQGFTRHSYIKSEQKPDYAYNTLLNDLITGVIKNPDLNVIKSKIIHKLYMESPLISDEAFEHLMKMCELEDELSDCAMTLIKELTVRRPPKQEKFLQVLLKYSVHNNVVLREKSIKNLIVLYSTSKILVDKIEKHALTWFMYMEKGEPSPEMFKLEYGRPETITAKWNEDLSKICLALFLGILPFNEKLVQTLSNCYKLTAPELKRTILRSLETPVKQMGPECKALLQLIEECPKGCETLITRIIYVLTEKVSPHPNVVQRVRDLYQTKVSDVRLLIPVIGGLTKQEIFAAIPKVLILTPAVVKEVFNRLLGITDSKSVPLTPQQKSQLPITPNELLVSLHNIDITKVDIKAVIKATALCLTEKEIYTQEIIANVLQQIVEITPLPTLVMRTIIQSLTLYPRLSGYITNLLQRLIPKQVWRQKVIWDGFLKCCQRLKPASFPVLMTLPPQPLQQALNTCPELRQPMLEYANRIVTSQNESVSKQTMDVLSGNTLDLFITETTLPESGVIPFENIKKEPEDADIKPILSGNYQPLPPGEDL